MRTRTRSVPFYSTRRDNPARHPAVFGSVCLDACGGRVYARSFQELPCPLTSASPRRPVRRFIARHAGSSAGRHTYSWRGCPASRLELHTSFSEPLPSNDPGVVTLDKTQKRIGDLSLLLVGIRSPDRQANLRYAEEITQKLRALPPKVVALATYHVRDIRDFFKTHQWLYVGEEDLTRSAIASAEDGARRKNPLASIWAGRGRPVEAPAQAIVSKDPWAAASPTACSATPPGPRLDRRLPPAACWASGPESCPRGGYCCAPTTRSIPPEMVAHIAGRVATCGQPGGGRARHPLGTVTCGLLVGLHPSLLPALAAVRSSGSRR